MDERVDRPSQHTGTERTSLGVPSLDSTLVARPRGGSFQGPTHSPFPDLRHPRPYFNRPRPGGSSSLPRHPRGSPRYTGGRSVTLVPACKSESLRWSVSEDSRGVGEYRPPRSVRPSVTDLSCFSSWGWGGVLGVVGTGPDRTTPTTTLPSSPRNLKRFCL